MQFRLLPSATLAGTVRVPGDKSISHRAVMLGSVARGKTVIHGFLRGEDTLATVKALQSLGVRIEDGEPMVVYGCGDQPFSPPAAEIDLGNSGTSIRLLMGLLCGRNVEAVLNGDESLRKRPMERVAKPLRQMGARIETTNGMPPVTIFPINGLQGICYVSPVASAQVKSAVLLAGLSATGKTTVVEPFLSRDHTERMLAAFGIQLERNGPAAAIEGGATLQGTTIAVPADISSAAFFLVAGVLAKGNGIFLPEVGVNPTRTGVLTILRAMGAHIEEENHRFFGQEPVADLRVYPSSLHGIEIPPEWVPSAIDEFPAIFIAASMAKGKTVLRGAKELRVKESDRIATMAKGLMALGIQVKTLEDGIIIEGKDAFDGGEIHAHGDHRVAMAFAMAATKAKDAIIIYDCDNVKTSFPGFADMARKVGLIIEVS